MLQLFSRASQPLKQYASTTSRLSKVASHFQPLNQYRMVASVTNNDEVKAANLFNVSHVTAIVTGGGTGIGLMITQALSANGAKVYITGRREDALDTVVKKYDQGPGKIIALPGDVSDKEDIKRIAKEIEQKEPKGIHLLVNNAGIARDQSTGFSKNGQPDMSDAQAISDHFMKSEMQSWLDTYQTNVAGGFFMAMALLPQLVKGHKTLLDQGVTNYTSSVINVSSISGAMKGSSNGQFAYAASKAAFTHVSRMLGTTFQGTHVRVNVIAPGIFPSEMTAEESDENNKSQLDKSSSNPSGRKGEDSDMAATVLLLASRGGTFYAGQIMYPDGGNTLAQPAVAN